MLPLVVRPHGAATGAVIARLSPGDRRRLEALDGPAAARFLSGRDALYAALDAAWPDAPANAFIDATCPDCGLAHGRPRLTGQAGPRLALSHAAGLAFAVAADGPVGIDAEPLDADPQQVAAAASLAPGPGHPLLRWTAIEATLKADGRGLRVDPSAVRLGNRRADLDGVRYRLDVRRLHGCLVTIAQAVSDGRRV